MSLYQSGDQQAREPELVSDGTGRVSACLVAREAGLWGRTVRYDGGGTVCFSLHNMLLGLKIMLWLSYIG